MPIRLRLAFAGVGVAALALLLFGLLFDRLAAIGVPEDQDRHLSTVAARAVAAVGASPADRLTLDESTPPPIAGDLASSTEPFVAVVDDAGTVLFSTADIGRLTDDLPDELVERVRAEGAVMITIDPDDAPELRLHVRRWDRPDADRAGLVLAGQATEFAEEQIAASRVFLIVSGLTALIAASVAAWVATGRALRPLRQLAATTDEIGRTGDLSRRLPPAPSGDVVGALTTSFNSMLERLGDAQDRLAGSVEAQRRFLADASHELRSPLTSIRSNAGFLVDHPDATAGDRMDALDDIAAESERMSRLVDGLLALARADAGQPLQMTRVDLAELADRVANRWRRSERAIQVRADRPAPVVGDDDALTRMVSILVDNAIVHGKGEIDIDIWRPNRRVSLAVADHGAGIDRADLERIFERFVRADRDGRERGAGLGLAIARSIAEAHGGTIRAANRDGGGAVFVVDLPAYSTQ
jgi:signal transduction histidine kinase